MPQFDLTTYSSQIFWLIVCFAIFSLYCLRVSVPKLNKVLGNRWSKNHGYNLETKKILVNIQNIEADIDQKLMNTYVQRDKIINDAVLENEEVILKYKSEISTIYKTKLEKFENNLMKSRNKSLEDLKFNIPSICKKYTAKIMDCGNYLNKE